MVSIEDLELLKRKKYLWKKTPTAPFLAGGNSNIFTSTYMDDSHFDAHIFQMGWKQPPTRFGVIGTWVSPVSLVSPNISAMCRSPQGPSVRAVESFPQEEVQYSQQPQTIIYHSSMA